MSKARRVFAGAATQTTITGNVTNVGLTFALAATTGWPSGASEFYVVVDPGTATEEKCLVTRSGSTLTCSALGKRGVDGTSAYAHSAGAAIYPVIAAQDLDDANFIASALTTKGDLVGYDTDAKRVAVGTDGQILTADSGQSVGLRYRNGPTTKGDLLGYSTDFARVPVGADKTLLAADSSQATGLAWVAGPTTKGDLLGYSTVPVRVAIGTDGQVLTADAASTPGLKWAATDTSLLTVKGDILSFSTVRAKLGVGTDHSKLVADSTQATGLRWGQGLTTKGDLPVFTTTEARLGVGADGTVLTASSGAASGVAWVAPYADPTTTKGDLLARNGAGAGGLSRLAVGTDGQVLAANSGAATGLAWANTVVDVNGASKIVQGATAAVTLAGAAYAFSFATPFPAACTVVELFAMHTGGASLTFCVDTITRTGFKGYVYNPATGALVSGSYTLGYFAYGN